MKKYLKKILAYNNPKVEKYIRYSLILLGVIIGGIEYSFLASVITFGAFYLVGIIIGLIIR